MTKSKKSGPPVERVALYDQLIALVPGLERKGDSMPYTSLNGHMTSFLDANGDMVLRLSAEDRERFMAEYGVELFVVHGTIMKEYVTLPDALLRDPEKRSVTLKGAWNTCAH